MMLDSREPITDVITQDKTARWREARIGRFTASIFSELICAKGKPTQTMLSRCAAVAAERITGMDAFSSQTKAMEWGLDLEEKAFEVLSDKWLPLQGATFVAFGEKAGATPDAYALIDGELSTVDIKCPFTSSQFVQWCAIGDGPEDLEEFSKPYYWQIMAQARFTGAKLCSLAYYDPRMPKGKEWKARTYTLVPMVVEIIDNAIAAAEIEVERFIALMQD